MTTVPYGAWPSPISAQDVARGGRTLGGGVFVGADPDPEVWWSEGRAAEAGRYVVVRRATDGTLTDLVPAGFNARTRVHEYGGVCWLPVPDRDGSGASALIFSNYADQRIYRVSPNGRDPGPITPAPPTTAALRYADPVLSPDRTEVWCVRESHSGGAVRRHLVAVPLDGSAADRPGAVRELAGGSDFLAAPAPSPDGARLAWIAWDHPRMPWDGTELRIADIGRDGTLGAPHTLLGGPAESILQPTWHGADELYAVSDRSGWWNLYRIDAGGGREPTALHPADEEFGGPLWTLGQTSYAVTDDGAIACLHGTAEERLGRLDPASGALADLPLPFAAFGADLHVRGRRALLVAGSPTAPNQLVAVDLDTAAVQSVRSASDQAPDERYLPVPRPITVTGPAGRDVHALVFAPTNPDAEGPPDERPPYVAFVHGGPTGHSGPALAVTRAYFTSRGVGVVEVNYGGSSGYGRAYRDRLRGQWGIVDVEDTVAVMTSLVESGEADGARLAIRGASAGGWTTLAALTTTDVFAAGTSICGVSELLHFVADTHDFESRYIDGLVGRLPQARELYVDRAPLAHVDELSCPVLLLQGAEDPIVPPSQAELFRDALARKGIRHAYLVFEGEQHGFRQAANMITALEAELSFYGQVLGLTPPGVPPLALAAR
ncbi:MAG: prolyl oligopeptidase family serine peptidase [Mycobacteriales bacterium]